MGPGPDGKPTKELRTCGTLPRDLLPLPEWWVAPDVTPGALASTGVSGKPVGNLLEGAGEILLVNAPPSQAVPGRKTARKDGAGIAARFCHGLLRGSVVPDRPQREWRERVRCRVALLRERAAETNRLPKTLDGANSQLAAVVTAMRGRSARPRRDALGEETTEPAALAHLAKGKRRSKIPALDQARRGRVGAQPRFLGATQLLQRDPLAERADRLSQEIPARLAPAHDQATDDGEDARAVSEDAARAGDVAAAPRRPPSFAPASTPLQSIPGVGQRTAESSVTASGTARGRFPAQRQRAAGAGLAPGNHERAGKRRGGTTRTGSPGLRCALVEAAPGAGRSQDTDLAAQ
jgi:transposase